MKRFLTLWAVVCAAVNVALSAAIDSRQARVVANAWAAENRGFASWGTSTGVTAETDAQGKVLWYVVTFSNGGAVITTADDRIGPVLTAVPKYSGVLPANHPLRSLLARDVAARLAMVDAAGIGAPVARGAAAPATVIASSDARAEIAAISSRSTAIWKRLARKAAARDLVIDFGGGSITPDNIIAEVPGFAGENKILTHWNQGDGEGALYDYYTPTNDTGKHAVCGCVATAGAALLQYYNVTGLPKNVTKECSMDGKKISLTTRGATQGGYDWASLPASYGGLAPENEPMLPQKYEDALAQVQDAIDEAAGLLDEAEVIAMVIEAKPDVLEGCEATTMDELRDWLLEQYGEEGLTEAQRQLIGRATSDVGICVKMKYTSDESGSYLKDLAGALKNDFRFLSAKYKGATSVNGLTAAEMKTYIYDEICATNPVALSIFGETGGHAILGVGYGEDTDGNSFTRLFMGWGGFGDAWYELPVIHVDVPLSDPMKFQIVDGVVYALRPPEKTILSATSPEDALRQALESDKLIMLVSGTVGEARTDALLGVLTNNATVASKCICYYADSQGDCYHYGDAIPAVGIFCPKYFDLEADTRWALRDGRLAYTNLYDAATGDLTDAMLEALIAEAEAKDPCKFGDVTLRISGILYRQDEEEPATASVQGEVTPAYGFHTNTFVNGEFSGYMEGQVVPFSAPAAVTNRAEGVVYECVGYQLVQGDTTNELQEATSGTLVAGTDEEVLWSWRPSKLRVSASFAAVSGGGYTPGTLSPTEAWVTPDGSDSVSLSVTPAANFAFDHWELAGSTNLLANPLTVTLPAGTTKPRAYVAVMAGVREHKLVVAAFPANIQGALGETVMPAYGMSYQKGVIGATNAPSVATIGSLVWTNTSWKVVGDSKKLLASGDGSVASFAISENATLTWLWKIDLAATLAENGWDDSTPISGTVPLGNLPAGVAAGEVEFVNIPKGWAATQDIAADGAVTASLAPAPDFAEEHLGVSVACVTLPAAMAEANDVVYNVSTNEAGMLVVTAPAAITNLEAGVVYAVRADDSWQASGSVVTNGAGVVAEVAYAEGDAITLTWNWEVSKVLISAQVDDATAGEVVPAEAWVAPGEEAEFTFVPTRGAGKPKVLSDWECDAEVWMHSGLTVKVTAGDVRSTLTAKIVTGAEFYLSIVGELPDGTRVTWGMPSPAYKDAADLYYTDLMTMQMTAPVYTNEIEETSSSCEGWQLRDSSGNVLASGTGMTAEFRQTANRCTFVWLWSTPEPLPEPEPEYAEPTAVAFTTIEKVDTGFMLTFSNAVKYCIYKLYSATSPAGFDLTAEPDQTLTAEADGPASFTVPATETSLFWTIVAEPGLIPAGE